MSNDTADWRTHLLEEWPAFGWQLCLVISWSMAVALTGMWAAGDALLAAGVVTQVDLIRELYPHLREGAYFVGFPLVGAILLMLYDARIDAEGVKHE